MIAWQNYIKNMVSLYENRIQITLVYYLGNTWDVFVFRWLCFND